MSPKIQAPLRDPCPNDHCPLQLDLIVESHEERLQSMERSHVDLAAAVAKNGAVVEQNSGAVKDLTDKLEELPGKIAEQVQGAILPLREQVGAISSTVNELKRKEDSRTDSAERRKARWAVAKTLLVSVVAATLGAFAKVLVDHYGGK